MKLMPACSGTLSSVIARLWPPSTHPPCPLPELFIRLGEVTHIYYSFLPPWCQATRAATALWNLKGALLWAPARRFTVCNTLQHWLLWRDLHKLNRNLASRCVCIKKKIQKKAVVKNELKSKLRFSPIFKMISWCLCVVCRLLSTYTLEEAAA